MQPCQFYINHYSIPKYFKYRIRLKGIKELWPVSLTKNFLLYPLLYTWSKCILDGELYLDPETIHSEKLNSGLNIFDKYSIILLESTSKYYNKVYYRCIVEFT